MFTYCLALLQQVKSDRKGITALEYGILAAIMVTALLAGFGVVTNSLTALFSGIAGHLTVSS